MEFIILFLKMNFISYKLNLFLLLVIQVVIYQNNLKNSNIFVFNLELDLSYQDLREL